MNLWPGMPPFFHLPGFGTPPVGTVIAFAGRLGAEATQPIEAWGWMPCDGRTLSSQLYPELFVALGYVYGGSGNQFKLPDYRGYFLRGVDGSAGNDPDQAMRSAPPGGQGPANGVGSIQPCALQTHEHTYSSAPAPSALSPSGTAAGAPSITSTLTTGGPVSAPGQSPPVRVSPNETRPLNAYVHYLIKFTYGLCPSLG